MNFTIPATSLRIITIVVSAIAILAIVGIGTLSAAMLLGLKPEPSLTTAYVGITSGLVGSLTGLLANTRSTPGADSDMPKTDKPTT